MQTTAEQGSNGCCNVAGGTFDRDALLGGGIFGDYANDCFSLDDGNTKCWTKKYYDNDAGWFDRGGFETCVPKGDWTRIDRDDAFYENVTCGPPCEIFASNTC